MSNVEVVNGNEVFMKYKYKRWGFVVFGAILMFCISICYAWSILNVPIVQEHPEWTEGQIALTFTIFMIVYAVFGILSGIIIRLRKGRVRLNLIISAIFLLAAFIVVSQAKNLFSLYLGFGFLGGIGVVFSYNSVITVVTRWFKDKLGTVTGALLMGYGLGSFIIGMVYSTIISGGADWRLVFIMFGVVLSAMALIGSFVLVPPPDGYEAPDLRKPKIDKHPIEPIECNPIQMIKRPSFWLLFGMGVCVTMASMGITSSARNLVQAVAPDTVYGEIAIIVGLISIFNAAGRIITGFLNDWGGLRFNVMISDTSVVVSTALVGIAVWVQSLPFLVIGFILFGFSAGMSTPDGAVVTQKFFGTKNYQINIQIVMLSGILNSLGATIMGSVFDATGNYVVPIFVLMGVAFIGWICAFFLRKP